MNVGFYAGSFDPFTKGHLLVVKKSVKYFDKVVVGIGINPGKKRRFDKDKMKLAIEESLKEEGLTNVEVITYQGLTSDAAIEKGADTLIRGIRNGMDYQYEENISLINEEISGLDTIYIRAGKLGMISSSMVMELLTNDKDVTKYVPSAIFKIL